VKRTLPRLLSLGLALGAAACATLLGIRETPPERFPHRTHAIEGIACLECHAGITEAGNSGPLHLPTEASCLECHEKPHDPRPCFQCHTEPFTQRRLADLRTYLRFAHDVHMKPLRDNCARCHTGAEDPDRMQAPMAVCLGCHEHKDEFRIRQCDNCHVNLPAEASLPETHLIHDEDFLRRHGVQAASAGDLCSNCHRESFCAECHGVTVAALPARFHFTDVMRNTVHRAGFFARHAQESRADPGLCITCHSERFCSDCHLTNNVHALSVGARNPHPPGWVGALGSSNEHGRAARRDPASCASCHGGAGEMLCVGCHRVGGIGGNPHPPGWSSRQSLTDMPCRLCHTPGLGP
jgi:hypothetical protein